jgi:hypothetical protein
VLGGVWFVWNVTARWYPALKERLGLSRVYKALLVLNALAWLPGFWLARLLINRLTGVDAGNFTTALRFFTLGGIAYVWLLFIMICIGLMALKSIVTLCGLMAWEHIRSFLWGLTLSVPPYRSVPLRRHVMDMFACMSVLFLLAILTSNPTARRVVKSVANFVLVATEFSYDHTCAASNETRWVTPLKDRKEVKDASNVLFADVQSWTDIHFSIGQCNKTP